MNSDVRLIFDGGGHGGKCVFEVAKEDTKSLHNVFAIGGLSHKDVLGAVVVFDPGAGVDAVGLSDDVLVFKSHRGLFRVDVWDVLFREGGNTPGVTLNEGRRHGSDNESGEFGLDIKRLTNSCMNAGL